MFKAEYEVFDKSGYTSTIYLMPGTRKVVKSFFPECIEHHFSTEKKVYERFSSHNHPTSILKYYGVAENDPAGLVLELAENRNLYSYLWDHDLHQMRSVEPKLLYRWAHQAATALTFAHSLGVIHSDIHCVNFVLDGNLDLKVADWAGASIDGSQSYSRYRTTHSLLCVQGSGSQPSLQSDIFGFASALHIMIVGYDIFPELDYEKDHDEIVRRLRDLEYPDTSQFPVLASVTLNCWKLKYESMQDVVSAIEAETKLYGDRE
ncbi:MAG: hypothetical protein L6R39_007469 [Caloplaca ligustica]|nr:MAG: hypothetical protein L6R39_007469 [Caloplaca ligustica]